jgi:hypothetical protein
MSSARLAALDIDAAILLLLLALGGARDGQRRDARATGAGRGAGPDGTPAPVVGAQT